LFTGTKVSQRRFGGLNPVGLGGIVDWQNHFVVIEEAQIGTTATKVQGPL
jgi:hypothetical protein